MTTTHDIHPDHAHEHGGADCTHVRIEHDGHADYLHDGHLHFAHDGHTDEHRLPDDAANPVACTDGHACGDHQAGHEHGPACGHAAVPHGDHTDYLVGTHLHAAHASHCDDHGIVTTR